MFFLPLLIGAGLAYVFLKRPSSSDGPSTGAYDDYGNDNGYGYPALLPGTGAYAYETPLLTMETSSSAPPPWPTQEPSAPFDAAAYSALSSQPTAPQSAPQGALNPPSAQNLGTLYAAQDKTPIRAEPGISADQRGMFTVYAGYPMTVLALDPSGWVRVELNHPQHGVVDGWTEIESLTAIAPAGSASSVRPSARAAGSASSGSTRGAAKAAQTGKSVPIRDANTNAIIGYRPTTTRPKRRSATTRAAGG